MPVLSKDSVIGSLKANIPDCEWLLGEIESQKGWFRFPDYLSRVITNLKIGNYPILYDSEGAMVASFLRSFMTDDEIKEFAAEVGSASVGERGELLADFDHFAAQFLDGLVIPKTSEEQEIYRRQFEALSEEDQIDAIKKAQYLYGFFLSSFYQNLSVMVHGEPLTSLVAKAKANDDGAFVRAVQIDRRLLTGHPYFIERYAKAQDGAETDFYDQLSYRLGRAPYVGKIRHKSLYLTFTILDKTGWLNVLPHREILEICDEVGVGGHKNRIADVGYLSKRIAEYRRFQKLGIASTQ